MMNSRQNVPRTTPATDNGVASAKHQGFRRPRDQQFEQALGQASLDERGELVEDQLRDRRSRGAPPASNARNGDGRNQR